VRTGSRQIGQAGPGIIDRIVDVHIRQFRGAAIVLYLAANRVYFTTQYCGTKNLNIRVNTSPSTVGSVKAVLSGAQSLTKTESSPPYAVFGESNYNYNAWVPKLGSYYLKATPYTGASASGTAGTTLSISFKVTNSAARIASVTVPEMPKPEPAALKLQVYPNPSAGNDLQVVLENFTGKELVNVVLYDGVGRVAHTRTLQTDTEGKASLVVPVNNLSKGYYIVKAQGKSGSKQAKVLID